MKNKKEEVCRLLSEIGRVLEGDSFFGEIIATFHRGRCDVVKTVKKVSLGTKIDESEKKDAHEIIRSNTNHQ